MLASMPDRGAQLLKQLLSWWNGREPDPSPAVLARRQERHRRDNDPAFLRLMEVALAKMRRVREAIDASGQDAGEIACPICGTGTVRFIGIGVGDEIHWHVYCSTHECVSWKN